MHLVAGVKVHVFVQYGTFGVFIRASFLFIGTAVVRFVIEAAETNPAKFVAAVGATHVLAAAFLVDEIAAFGTIFGEFGNPFGTFAFQRGFRSPIFDHFTIRGRMRFIAASKAKFGVTMGATDIFIAQ